MHMALRGPRRRTRCSWAPSGTETTLRSCITSARNTRIGNLACPPRGIHCRWSAPRSRGACPSPRRWISAGQQSSAVELIHESLRSFSRIWPCCSRSTMTWRVHVTSPMTHGGRLQSSERMLPCRRRGRSSSDRSRCGPKTGPRRRGSSRMRSTSVASGRFGERGVLSSSLCSERWRSGTRTSPRPWSTRRRPNACRPSPMSTWPCSGGAWQRARSPAMATPNGRYPWRKKPSRSPTPATTSSSAAVPESISPRCSFEAARGNWPSVRSRKVLPFWTERERNCLHLERVNGWRAFSMQARAGHGRLRAPPIQNSAVGGQMLPGISRGLARGARPIVVRIAAADGEGREDRDERVRAPS